MMPDQPTAKDNSKHPAKEHPPAENPLLKEHAQVAGSDGKHGGSVNEKPTARLPEGFTSADTLWPKNVFALLIEHFNKDQIPSALSKELADQKTGITLDRIDVIHYKNGDLVVGYNHDKQVLLKSGGALYINPSQDELNKLTASGSQLSKLGGGKPGWYLKEGNNLRKTLYEDYRFSEPDGVFITRSNDGSAQAWMPDGEIIKGKINTLGAFIGTDVTPKSNGDIPAIAEPQLEERLDFNINDQAALERYLKANYNATFSNDGEQYVCHQNPVISRRPSGQEVHTAWQALKEFGLTRNPDNDKTFKPDKEVKFVFTTHQIGQFADISGMYDDGKIFSPPGYNFDRAQNRQIQWQFEDASRGYRREGTNTLETLCVKWNLEHELGHWADDKRDPVAWKKDYRREDLSRRFGFGQITTWVPNQFHPGQTVQFVKEAVKGKDNTLFLRDLNPNESRWDRYSQDGRQILENVSFDQMAQMAQIPPGTIFWTSSKEASAETKTAATYIAGKSRDHVRDRSPQAYVAAVIADQEDIDFFRPGEGLMRAANGGLVKKSRAALNALDSIARQALTGSK